MPDRQDIPDDVRELLRDAWTLISAWRKGLRFDNAKTTDWRNRFSAVIGARDEFGDLPDSDDVP